jgi:hypothetical protein
MICVACDWCFLGWCCVSSQKWIGVLFFGACFACSRFLGSFPSSWTTSIVSFSFLVSLFPVSSRFLTTSRLPTTSGAGLFMSFFFLSSLDSRPSILVATSCYLFVSLHEHYVNMSRATRPTTFTNHSIAPLHPLLLACDKSDFFHRLRDIQTCLRLSVALHKIARDIFAFVVDTTGWVQL